MEPCFSQDQANRNTKADKYFYRGEYYKSVDLFLKMNKSAPTDIYLIQRIADCYRLMSNYDAAEQWYARAVANKSAKPINAFYYAEMLLRNKKIDQAREQYRQYFAKSNSKELRDFKLRTCDSAELWMKQDSHFKVNDERSINSIYADWGAVYQDTSGIIFTSNRSTTDYKGDEGIDYRTGTEWFKLFLYNFETGSTQELPYNNSGTVDLTKYYHTGPIALNSTGDTAYITITSRLGRDFLPKVKIADGEEVYTRRLELIMATKRGGRWGGFTRFPYNNVRAYSIGHAALSKNGQTIYFTSDMPGGQGKTDIWYCRKGSDGKWAKPVNCGKTINTPEDEAFPTVLGNDTLYYSSTGLQGMGGYDIFMAQGSANNWSKPVNLKYPANSTSDDFCFVSRDGKSGYLSSDRQGGQGSDDIYSFSYSGKNKPENKPVMPPPVQPPMAKAPVPIPVPVNTPPVVATPAGLITLQAMVYDNKTRLNMDSVTVILKNSKNETIAGDLVFTGKKFEFKIGRGQVYTIEAHKRNYYPVSQTILTANAPPDNIIRVELNMEPLAVGKTFVIHNIYYNLNRANIRPDAAVELDKLVTMMQENPSMRIELSSHTDSRGSDYYNMLLSQARAISAVAYMKRHGIAADRMVAKGYGETRLINDCGNGVPCSEEEHQENRRTEIKIIGGTFK